MPSTPTKNVVGLKRARNMREKEILDRTLPHLDHADNPRQTTHAVGVLKAVSLGKQYPGWVWSLILLHSLTSKPKGAITSQRCSVVCRTRQGSTHWCASNWHVRTTNDPGKDSSAWLIDKSNHQDTILDNTGQAEHAAQWVWVLVHEGVSGRQRRVRHPAQHRPPVPFNRFRVFCRLACSTPIFFRSEQGLVLNTLRAFTNKNSTLPIFHPFFLSRCNQRTHTFL